MMIEFFANGQIPNNSAEFHRAFSNSTLREQLALGALIRNFTPDQIRNYAVAILKFSNDERLLAMTFLVPDVIDKMCKKSLYNHLKLIHKMKLNNSITPDFFEVCAASLVRHCNPLQKINFMGLLSSVVDMDDLKVRPTSLYELRGSLLDLAVSENMEELLLMPMDERDFLPCWYGLECFELPITLGVLLRNKMSADDSIVVTTVSRLFTDNKLTDRYIEVCRSSLGDEQFLAICQSAMEDTFRSGHLVERLRSVEKLSPIFGEKTFHTPQFFESLFREDAVGHVPRYISSLNTPDLYEIDLPVMRAFIVDNLERLIFFKPTYQSNRDLTISFVSLAHQEGLGAKALTLVLQRIGDLIDGEAFDPFAVMIESLFNAPDQTERSVGNEFLHHVVDKVGLKTLHEVVPDVGLNFLGEFLEKKKPAMNEREILRLFPQMKGKLLEDQLGL